MATGKSIKIIARKRSGRPAKKDSAIIGGINLGIILKRKFLQKCGSKGYLPSKIITELVHAWTSQ